MCFIKIVCILMKSILVAVLNLKVLLKRIAFIYMETFIGGSVKRMPIAKKISLAMAREIFKHLSLGL